MKKRTSPDIKLVITIALRKEAPKEWFESHGVPVYTLASLKAGALKAGPGMLIVITGPGLDASGEAARWIRDNLKPLFVINIGTCGIRDKGHPLGGWIAPSSAADESGNSIALDKRMPLPHSGHVMSVGSLLSVRKVLDGIPMEHDAVDMECYAQAEVFADSGTTFHCLKFTTDYSDSNAINDFNRNLGPFSEGITELFGFMRLPFHSGGREGSDITVVVPVHDRESTIGRAIDSVLSQSLPPDEIIVVDDCSTDRTVDILEGYGDKITLIHLPEKSGPSRARNTGITRAGTEWVALLDSDDSWENKRLENQAAYLRKYPFYQIMQSDEKWIRNGKRVNPRKHHEKPEGWIWERSLERCLVSPSAVLARKRLLQQYGMFDEHMPVCEDYDLWLKIARHHPVGLDPVLSVVKYGGHDDQLSANYPAMDRLRAASLYRMLEAETEEEYRQKLICVLEQKLHILMNGYKKRDRITDLRECEEMLAALEGNR